MRTESLAPSPPKPSRPPFINGPRLQDGAWIVELFDSGSTHTETFPTKALASAHVRRLVQEGKGRKSKRGFAGMDAERHREIASAGGRRAHEKGVAHEFTSDEAREAGRKGGEKVAKVRGREHMGAIGRIGGVERGRRARERKAQRARSSP